VRRPTRKSFGSKAMTRKQNGLQFTMWLKSCADNRLTAADPQSLANMYGMTVPDVSAQVDAERRHRGC